MAEEQIGRVTHYFGKAGVAAIEITSGTLAVGDTIRIKGHTSDFTQQVDSMQIDGKPVQQASTGQSVGLRVAQHAREHDVVHKVSS
jgi:putative protease